MTPASTSRWHAVARAKLTAVLGAAKAEDAMRDTLAKIGRRELRSADDLYLFAEALAEASGFTGTIGGLLTVHALLHGAHADTE